MKSVLSNEKKTRPSASVYVYWALGPFFHDDVIKWKHFPRYWPFVRGIHRSPVNSPHKGQWRGALMFTLICARINACVNNREAGDLRRYRPHYDVIVKYSNLTDVCSRHTTVAQWRHQSRSLSIQVMWCCQAAPRLCLHRCWRHHRWVPVAFIWGKVHKR